MGCERAIGGHHDWKICRITYEPQLRHETYTDIINQQCECGATRAKLWDGPVPLTIRYNYTNRAEIYVMDEAERKAFYLEKAAKLYAQSKPKARSARAKPQPRAKARAA